MKIRLLFINIILLALISFSPPEEEVIVWKEGYLLQPQDFKGKIHDADCVASATCDIDKKITNYNDSAIVTIEAVFLPYRSWKRIGRSEVEILMHEQKHFDITELYARKLRKQIKEDEFNDLDELSIELSHYHKKIMEDLDNYQDKYDTKTNHSMNGNQQIKWNKNIATELNNMDYFKNTLIVVHFKKLHIPDTVSK